ncbi:MAG: site-specific tyrosine recombinase XerC [Actinomycetota bacterium]|nr:site-specific tyrosine recombinase XerC [Actinomycetota bacterium]
MNRQRPKKDLDVTALVAPVGDPQGMRARMADFLRWMQVRHYTDSYVVSRAKCLDGFAAWAEGRGLAKPGEVTKPVLERYQRHLFYYRKKNGQPLTSATQYYRLMSLKMFFRWLARQNLVLSNPASDLDMPRVERRLPKAILTAAEVETVMARPDTATPLGLRDRAILEVLYSTGIRRRELTELTVFNLDFERGTLMVRQGKGKKDRMLPIGSRALAWVDKYLQDARPRLVREPDPNALFLTEAGEALTPNYLSYQTRRYVEASGLRKRGSCHLFRHTMATLMLEGGADIRFIQAMLGHADLQATSIYTQVAITKLKEVHEATHPGARLRAAGEHQDRPDQAQEQDLRDDLLHALDAEAADEDQDLDAAAEE